jgi:O-antigen/teichoic acid export membrane protein
VRPLHYSRNLAGEHGTAALNGQAHSSSKDSAIIIVAFAVASAGNYAFGVALGWYLSPAEFGVAGVVQSLLLIAGIPVANGFSWAVAQDVAISGLTAKTRRRFRAAWVANMALGVVIAGFVWGSYQIGWLALGPDYMGPMSLLSLAIVLLAARSVIIGVVQGNRRFGQVAANQVGEVVIRFGSGLAMLWVGAGVTAVTGAFALGAGATALHSVWITRRERLWRGSGWIERGLAASSAPYFLSMLGVSVMLNIDILGLKLLSSASEGNEMIGFYQAAVTLARIPAYVAQALVLVLFAYAAEAKGTDTVCGLTAFAFAKRAIRAWSGVLVPVGLGLLLWPRAALGLLFPAAYQAAALSLQIAAVGATLLALVTLLSGVLQAAGDRHHPVFVIGVASSCQVLCLVILVPQLGAIGAALSLLTGGIVGVAGLLTRLGMLTVASRGSLDSISAVRPDQKAPGIVP